MTQTDFPRDIASERQIPRHTHWIGGQATSPNSERYLATTNPATEETVAEIALGDSRDVGVAVEAARRAQPAWAALSPLERGRVLATVASAIRDSIASLSEAELADTGKIEPEVVADINTAANYFEYYGSVIRAFHGDTVDLGPQQHVFTRREPFGVIGIITPWNAAIGQAARGIAPALAVGNAVVLKPSEFTSLSSLKLVQIAEDAGLPAGLLNVVTGLGADVGAAVVQHEGISRITFTGSVATGTAVARAAADRLIPVTLELGGKSPNIIFADADLDVASSVAAHVFTVNAGQACTAGTRILIERSVFDQVVEKIALKLDGLKAGASLGPIITGPQFDKVQRYLEIANEEGAVAVRGGTTTSVDGKGSYITPTLYTNVSNDMRIAQEEVFGPVAVAIPFDDESEAVRLANQTDYGLVAAVWTSNINRAMRVSGQLEAGQVFVNDWTANVETPFGGYKQSGYGREKGVEALAEYSRLKSVLVRINLDSAV